MAHFFPVDKTIKRKNKGYEGFKHVTYSRYGFSSQDAKASGGVLRWVEFPSAKVEFIRKRGGEDHPNNI